MRNVPSKKKNFNPVVPGFTLPINEQKVLKSPGYIAKISSPVTPYVPSTGNGDQPIFPFFFQSCPYLPLFSSDI